MASGFHHRHDDGVDPVDLLLKEARKDYLLATEYTGLKEEWLGQSFKIRNEPLVIVGLRSTSRNEYVLLENRQHKHKRAPIDLVIKAMGGTVPAKPVDLMAGIAVN